MSRDGVRWYLRRVFQLPLTKARVRGAVTTELRFHIEGRIEELMAAGLTREDAESEARRRFGDFESYRGAAAAIDEQIVHERERAGIFSAIERETRQSARALLRNRGFTITAILTLGLGLGAATAIFTMLDAVVLRPLPYPRAERLVELTSPVPKFKGDTLWGLARHEAFFFRENARSISDVGVYQNDELTVGGEGTAHPPERARALRVSAALFHVLSVKAEAGRLILEDDNHLRTPTIVALSHNYWERRFGGRPDVLNTVIDVEGYPMTIVGIIPESAQLPDETTDIWLPAFAYPGQEGYNNHTWGAIGLLREGFTAEMAERELVPLTNRLPEVFPNAEPPNFVKNTGFRTQVRALRDVVVGDAMRRALWILFAAVLVVLLIAAANLSNLFLVRVDARRREMAVRAALGADRLRIAVKYLSESMLIAIVAGMLALTLAQIGLRVLLALAPSSLPRLSEVHLGLPEVVFAAGGAFVTGLFLGLAPLLARRSMDLEQLRDGGRGLTHSRRRHLMRGTLVVTQIALSLVLLAGAGLMIRSFQKLRAIQPGFDPRGVLTMTISIPQGTYGKSYRLTSTFYEQLAGKVKVLPTVTQVGFSEKIPLEGRNLCTGVTIETPNTQGARGDCPTTAMVSPGYFEAMGIKIDGQPITWAGMDNQDGAMIVSRAFANRTWPNESAIGKGLRYYGNKAPWYRVTGVADDVLADGSDKPPVAIVYFPMRALDSAGLWDPPTQLSIAVRTSAKDPSVLAPAIARAVSEIEPRAATSNPQTMESIVTRSMSKRTFTMLLLGIAAGIALFLTIVGLYGTISYVVGQRRGEIAIRIALGAQVRQVARMVMQQAMLLAVLGVLIGVLGALTSMRVLQSLLFGVSPTDPVLLIGASLLLVSITALASYAPSRRAAQVAPAEAMRSE